MTTASPTGPPIKTVGSGARRSTADQQSADEKVAYNQIQQAWKTRTAQANAAQ